MSQFTTDDQWRSFQTYIAVYLAGMLHPLDVFTISRKQKVSPPLMEFRYLDDGVLRFAMGALAWSDEPGDFVPVRRDDVNEAARQVVELLRSLDDIDEPRQLRLSGTGPASSVAVLAGGGFMSGKTHPARHVAHIARMTADIDVDGDVIQAAAKEEGDRVFAATKSGSIAAIACAKALASLRTWIDPFSPTPESGYLVAKPRDDADG